MVQTIFWGDKLIFSWWRDSPHPPLGETLLLYLKLAVRFQWDLCDFFVTRGKGFCDKAYFQNSLTSEFISKSFLFFMKHYYVFITDKLDQQDYETINPFIESNHNWKNVWGGYFVTLWKCLVMLLLVVHFICSSISNITQLLKYFRLSRF